MPTTDRNKRRKLVPLDDAAQHEGPSEDDVGRLADTPVDDEPTIDIVGTWRRRRRLQIAALTAGLVLIVVWFAPLAISHTPLRNRVLASAAGELEGSITAERASLGWFSPVVLEGLEIRDAEGQPVVRVPTISGTTSLWRLVWDSHQLGRFQLIKPEVHVVLTDDSSNLEKLFAHWLESSEEKTLLAPALELELVDGTISLDDAASQQHWQLEGVGASLKLAHNWVEPLQVKLSATLPQPDRAARIEGTVELRRTAAAVGPPTDHGEATLDAHDLPLKLAEPFLRRMSGAARISGWLSANVRLDWDDAGEHSPALNIDGELQAEQLALSGVFAGRDELRLAHIKLPCRASLHDGLVTLERGNLDCDLGKANLHGPIRVVLDDAVLPRLLEALSRETYELDGQIDLAKVAALLPETLRIREGTQVTAGQVTWQLARRKVTGEARWEGNIETSNLVAVNQGRQLTWEKPVHVDFAAHDGESGLVVDKLNCQSSFLQLEAAGTLEEMSFTANYDLNRLAGELGQFVDLRDLQLAGDGWTYITCQRKAAGAVEADGEFQIRKFRLAHGGGQAWAEENLVINASLAAQAQSGRLHKIDSATLKVESKPDLLTVRLTQPVEAPTAESTWPVEFKLQGQLATWLPRLEPWLGRLEGWRCSGQCDVQGIGSATPDALQIEQARCHVAELRAHSPGLRIDEPDVELKLSGTVSRRDSQMSFPSMTLVTSTLSFNAADVSLAIPPGEPPQLGGVVAYAADVGRLQRLTLIAPEPPLQQLGGRLQGQVRLIPSAQGVEAHIDTQIENLSATRPDQPAWLEPQIRLVGKGRFDRAADLISLEQFHISSSMLRCDATGRIASLRGRRDLDLTGKLDYDHEKLFALLQPYIGQGVQISAGRESRPFSLRGPLAALSEQPALGGQPLGTPRTLLQEFSGDAGFGWTGANVYGFRVGSGELRGKLADGIVTFVPLDLAVSDGRLAASPRVRLSPEPMEFTLDRGPLLSQVHISPEMCEQGLKYIAPVLAGVTQAEGRFSIAMDGCRLPLDQPAAGELAGTFAVHSVDITPGPLVQALATLLERNVRGAKLKRESSVPFRMVQGRVYHRDLELVFNDVTVRTHGSVGLDGTLALLAEVPVQPKWVGEKLAPYLKDQTIKLPISGTLDRPRPELAQALEQLTRDALKSEGRNLLLDNLNKGLERLFQPPQAPRPTPSQPPPQQTPPAQGN